MTAKTKGAWLAISGCICWGASGAFAQYLFTHQGVTPSWLVGMRLAIAGILLLIWGGATNPGQLVSIWRHWRSAGQLLAFALCGMVPSQFTYFSAVNYGNAATATILQFTGPLFIIGALAVIHRQWPRRIDFICALIALFGVYLIVTKGHLTSLQLAPLAVFWGILAGASQALYTLIPIRLLRHFDAKLVTGWAMLLGSLIFMPHIVMNPTPPLNTVGWSGVVFVGVIGTMFAYLLYLDSLKYLQPATTGMLSSFEPLSATLITVVVLHTAIGLPEVVGGLLVLATAFLQAFSSEPLTRIKSKPV
ncbi:DMT family transporter [uncultured Secundilactobacillus sp.]|uniref:EamA family transporter n=1 Tax=uncultured Secundilactobacillus sp. TaxID=2813935 RepID=UPI002597A8D0|nr:DMT family transporter [uncultured Secundilactobacillus sp.]